MAQPSPEAPQGIDTLRTRYDELNRKKITAEANLGTSLQNLENLKREAREKYETDDLAELKRKLEEMEADNERKRAEYQQHLTAIESQLATVETEHTQAARGESQL